jgi:hypothetical protein
MYVQQEPCPVCAIRRTFRLWDGRSLRPDERAAQYAYAGAG